MDDSMSDVRRRVLSSARLTAWRFETLSGDIASVAVQAGGRVRRLLHCRLQIVGLCPLWDYPVSFLRRACILASIASCSGVMPRATL